MVIYKCFHTLHLYFCDFLSSLLKFSKLTVDLHDLTVDQTTGDQNSTWWKWHLNKTTFDWNNIWSKQHLINMILDQIMKEKIYNFESVPIL